MVLTPFELAFVNFDDLALTTNVNGDPLQIHFHGYPAKHAPVCDCLLAEPMFVLYLSSTFAGHDVVPKKHNFLEGGMTPVEPGAVPYRPGLIALDPTEFLLTSPPIPVLTFRISTQRHISPAGVTLLLAPK
jgi:hypothetical protein